MNWRLFRKYLARIVWYAVVISSLSVVQFWLLTISTWFLLVPVIALIVALAAYYAEKEEGR